MLSLLAELKSFLPDTCVVSRTVFLRASPSKIYVQNKPWQLISDSNENDKCLRYK